MPRDPRHAADALRQFQHSVITPKAARGHASYAAVVIRPALAPRVARDDRRGTGTPPVQGEILTKGHLPGSAAAVWPALGGSCADAGVIVYL